MRILLCAEITCGSTRKTVNLHVELVSDVKPQFKDLTNRLVGPVDFFFAVLVGTSRRLHMFHPKDLCNFEL